MSYYSVWSQKSEDISDPKQYEKYIQKYYVLEREAYRYLLNDYAGDRKQSEAWDRPPDGAGEAGADEGE